MFFWIPCIFQCICWCIFNVWFSACSRTLGPLVCHCTVTCFPSHSSTIFDEIEPAFRFTFFGPFLIFRTQRLLAHLPTRERVETLCRPYEKWSDYWWIRFEPIHFPLSQRTARLQRCISGLWVSANSSVRILIQGWPFSWACQCPGRRRATEQL